MYASLGDTADGMVAPLRVTRFHIQLIIMSSTSKIYTNRNKIPCCKFYNQPTLSNIQYPIIIHCIYIQKRIPTTKSVICILQQISIRFSTNKIFLLYKKKIKIKKKGFQVSTIKSIEV